MIKTTRNPTPHQLGYQLSSNKGFLFLNPERSEIPRRCNLHRRGCASMAPQAPSKQTVTHTFCENRIPLPPKKKEKNSVPASKWVKVTLLLLQASSSLSPNHAMHTHKLDSAAQEETSVMVTFASSIWPHGLFRLPIP